MNAPAYHDQLLPLMQGTKVMSVSKSALQDTIISFPSCDDEQRQIGQYFMALDNLITLHQHRLDYIKKYKKGLLQQMFV
jgi:type I restriction enzyme S subunit